MHSELEREIAKLQAPLKECNAALSQNTSLIDNLREQLGTAETQRIAAMAETNVMTANRDQSEAAQVRLNEQMIELKDQLHRAEARMKTHETSLEAQATKGRALDEQNAQILAAITQERDIARQALEEAKIDVHSAKMEIERLEADRGELAKWKDNLVITTSERDKLLSQKTRTIRLVFRLAAAQNKTRAEKARVQADHRAATNEIARLKAYVSTLANDRERERRESQQLLESWKSRAEGLEEKVARQNNQAVADRAAHEDEMLKLYQDQRKLQQTCLTAEKAYKDLQVELASAREEIEHQEDATYDANMREQNNGATSQRELNVLNEQIDKLRKAITQTSSELELDAPPEKEVKGKFIRLHYLRYHHDCYDGYVRYFPAAYAEELTEKLGLRSTIFCQHWTLAFPPSYMIITESTASHPKAFGKLWRDKEDLYVWSKRVNNNIGYLTDSLKPTLKRPREADRSGQASSLRVEPLKALPSIDGAGSSPTLASSSVLQLAAPRKRRMLEDNDSSSAARHELRIFDVSEDDQVTL